MSGELHKLPNLESILSPGQIVGGRYRVDKLMAEGGMAAVWAGHNERTGKRVALKVILQSMAAVGEAAELFLGEALAASKINHPNVVSIFDVVDQGSMACIVMELLDGETLDLYLARNGPLSLQETAALLLPAMRGVAAAHAQGVVHRDLKPGNIFLCKDADGRLLTSKVLDFGIATMMGRSGAPANVTDLRVRMGTPAYMSPEAVQCSPDMDGRMDVYAFGVLFFEALTGRVPFSGEPGIELFASILDDPPPKVTFSRPDLPPEVVQIVDRALAKNADDRFPDMDHLIRAVEALLLPPSQVPRALTPAQGMVPVQRAESRSGAGTRFLGGQAEIPPGRVFKKPGLADIVTQMRRWLTYFTGFGRPPRRQLVIAAGFAVVFVVAAFLAIAARPRLPGMGKKNPPSSVSPVPAKGPRVTPLANGPKQALSLTASRPGNATIRSNANMSAVPSRMRIVRKTDPADRTGVTVSRRRSPGPRAGRLSPADF